MTAVKLLYVVKYQVGVNLEQGSNWEKIRERLLGGGNVLFFGKVLVYGCTHFGGEFIPMYTYNESTSK